MSMIWVDGVPIKTPSAFSWGLQDVSAADAGRTDDTIMHKNRLGQKRKIALAWNNPSKEETAIILQAFNPEYFMVTYPDAMSGENESREFYAGDRSSPMKIWTVGNKRYEQLSFDIIER
nr:MAG TPA: hypothetical protein [Bacteriophage sp.]